MTRREVIGAGITGLLTSGVDGDSPNDNYVEDIETCERRFKKSHEMEREYVKEHGRVCPFCHKQNVRLFLAPPRPGSISMSKEDCLDRKEKLAVAVECDDCHRGWVDYYKLDSCWIVIGIDEFAEMEGRI